MAAQSRADAPVFHVEVPNSITEWQAGILAVFVGLLGGQLLPEGNCPQELGHQVLRLPSLASSDKIRHHSKDQAWFCRASARISRVLPASDSDFVDIEVEHATGGAQVKILAPADATFGELKKIIAQSCGDAGNPDTSRIRLLRRWSASTFLPFRDDELLAGRRKLLAMGVNFTKLPACISAKQCVPLSPKTKQEATGLLAAAMELLENSNIQQALAALDTQAGGVLAAWEPPWEEHGVEELDAQSLANVSTEIVLSWAKSFAEVVSALRQAAAAAPV